MHVLVLEDDKKISSFIAGNLRQEAHEVDVALDGQEGLRLANDESKKYDVIVLDLMLPRVDGFAVIQDLRKRDIATPVLMLSALASVDDRVKGLESGGDDYMIKPFSFHELSARLKALVRRTKGSAPPETLRLTVANLTIDLITRRVHRDGKMLEISPKEYALLVLMAQNLGNIVTKTMILERIWDWPLERQRNLVDTLVFRLRTVIDRGYEPKLIHTVHNMGYVLRVETETRKPRRPRSEAAE